MSGKREEIFVIFLKFVFYFWVISFGFLQACENRVFDLELQDFGVKIYEVLGEFANECSFSVVLGDEAVKEHLNRELTMVNFKGKDLNFVFDLLFKQADLHYVYSNDVLLLKSKETKTYKINYVSTNRVGISNTSVSINHEDNSSRYSSYVSSTEDSQATSKSGINITSEDGFNFWETIEGEILGILGQKENDSRVVLNKGAGLISVRGSKRELERVESYIQSLHQRLQKQVLIDVHILSITHNNTNTTGINWDELYNLQNLIIPAFGEGASFGGNGEVGNTSGINIVGQKGVSNLHYGINIFSQGLSLNRIIEFLESYGKVESISNPKVLTLNNQPAMISVGDILRYQKNTIYQNTNAQTTLTNTDNEYPSLFAGVLLDITPLVFGEEIMLKINPSITKTKENRTEIPNTAFETPPNLTTNQLSSIVSVKNNQKVILGGLISKNFATKENKIPILGSIPLIKPLFSYSQEVENTEEIVFIIEPKIIQAQDSISLEALGYSLIKEE
ncbi:pilus (MSHA type) biogenesis protein MshL [Helicobacter canadensis MIT 98-5491]|nr:pilus (MSHA type) biogenesis protein MshL [Helicobacter canadensis MIT 98-5491]STO99960.1 Type IV pilus biogenesis and competence protein pilQ precursor [Helicobacter canadensis]